MQNNKIFRYANNNVYSLRTSIHIDGCIVKLNRDAYEFDSNEEAEAFFNRNIQELLTQGWHDSESIPADDNSTNLTPDEIYHLFTELTEQLDEFVAATAKPCLEITAHPTLDTTLWQSKFGGCPYFPQNHLYPTAPNGRPLHLLAQINFAEAPTIEDFPKQGILQFYIDTSGQTAFGLIEDAQIEQSTFRILYFPEPDSNPDNLLSNFDFLPEPIGLPLEGCFALNLEVKSSAISGSDYQFCTLIKDYFPIFQQDAENIDIEELLDDLTEEYEERYDTLLAGHRLGGYPHFVQEDRRPYFQKGEDYSVLLFQMDSDAATSIRWGDLGVGHFFIQPSALKRLDFSQVMYTYACS